VLRAILDAVPLTLLLIAAVGFRVAVVLLAVWLIRRIVPATSEGFHAEISAPMVGVVAALFGLLLAFVIVIAYQNFLDADDNVSREADSLASIVRDSAAFPEPGVRTCAAPSEPTCARWSTRSGHRCTTATTALSP
jgi:hypothetical protein